MDKGKRQRRVELMSRICECVCEGNEFQALRFVRERNELGSPGILREELAEWKYDLIGQGSLISQSLRTLGVSQTLLEVVFESYMRRIDQALDLSECRMINEEMTIRFCQLSNAKNDQKYPMLIQSALQEIDRDLSQPLTLQHLSASLNVNRSYLSSLFRRVMGITLTEYVTKRRIDYASELLSNTQYPIKNIAKQAGIPDVQYFSRLFKKNTGLTPSQYRLGSNPDRG